MRLPEPVITHADPPTPVGFVEARWRRTYWRGKKADRDARFWFEYMDYLDKSYNDIMTRPHPLLAAFGG